MVVATDDQRIAQFCRQHNMEVLITSTDCRTGTERVREAAQAIQERPDFVVNLQGDNPLCPPGFVETIIDCYLQDNSLEVVTPCVQLSWKELDILRQFKKHTPFSGTTVIVNQENKAIWFSKNIIPAIRQEKSIRERNSETGLSPIYRHIGLYGYRYDILDKIAHLPQGFYEKLEGLEQLRFIDNGIDIRMVKVDYGNWPGMSGVDSPDDVQRAEKLISDYGKF